MFILTAAWLLAAAGTAAVHWALPPRLRGPWIVLASAAFLAALSPASLALLAGLTALFYAGAGRAESIGGGQLALLAAAAGGALLFYKARAALFPAGIIDLDPMTEDFAIPLGLSYYALRCLHYAAEKYKGALPPHGFMDFARYQFFLPALLAGPIHRFPTFLHDLQRSRWDAFLFAQGLERILFGYFKIAVLANLLLNNYLGVAALEMDAAHPALAAWLNMVRTGANIYFLFAGYSDVAIGFGMLLGFRMMENFNFPFLARNISDFWSRWHISLTSWCRDYVYMGTIAATRSAAMAAVAAMAVMGLWHEMSLRYLLWGLYHGAGIAAWQWFQTLKPRLPRSGHPAAAAALRVLSTVLTLHYVLFGVLLAHHSAPSVAFAEISKMFRWVLP